MKIKFEASSAKDLKKLDPQIRKKIFKKTSSLSKYPFLGKKLEGEYKGLRSFRVWPYRVIYGIVNKEVRIYAVKHRQSVYK